jgi:hypothetical protein
MREQQHAEAKGVYFHCCTFTHKSMDNGEDVHIKVQVPEENENLFQIWDKVSPVLRKRRNRRPY